MAIAASAVPTVQSLLQNRAQLKSRLAQVNSAKTLDDMLMLVSGTSVEAAAFTLAQSTMSAFIQKAVTDLETQLTTDGITLDV